MSSPAIKNVLIVGASGTVGRPVLAALLQSGLFNVSVLSRDSSTASFSSAVRVFKSDFTEASLAEACAGQDAVVCTLGNGTQELQIRLVDAAAAGGVKRFITSDFGGDVTNPAAIAAVPSLASKRAIVDHIQTKSSSGLSWTAIVNGVFLDLGLAYGVLGFQFKTHQATFYNDGKQQVTISTFNQVKRAVVSVLSSAQEQTANRHVYVQSFTVDQRALLGALERVTGKTFTVQDGSVEGLREKGLEAVSKGDRGGFLDLLRFGLFGEGNGGDFGLVKSDDGLLGLEEEDLDEAVERALHV